MDVFCGGKRSGKSYYAVTQSAFTGATIVCMHKSEAKRIKQIAAELSLKIPEPMTFDDFKNNSKIKHGTSGYVIDNADILLSEMAGGRPVQAITVTYEPQKNPYIIDDAEYVERLTKWDPKQIQSWFYGDWENTGDIEPQLIEPHETHSITIPVKRMTKKEIKAIYGKDIK